MIIPTPVFFGAGRPHRMVDLEVSDPGPGEVRVAMAASGVCHSCLYAIDGQHASIPAPIVLGDEGAGIVETVGAGRRLGSGGRSRHRELGAWLRDLPAVPAGGAGAVHSAAAVRSDA